MLVGKYGKLGVYGSWPSTQHRRRMSLRELRGKERGERYTGQRKTPQKMGENLPRVSQGMVQNGEISPNVKLPKRP